MEGSHLDDSATRSSATVVSQSSLQSMDNASGSGHLRKRTI